jgi:two-component system sensor histidine kinase YesM
MANVQSYMTIQTFRYKTRLTCEATVDPSLNDFEVPKLILQPLIENAIYHGIKAKDGPGRIELTCEKIPSGVRIRVTDDGVGMSEEQLAHLRTQIESNDVTSRDSYGVLNVYERLRLFFRDKCQMKIDSTPGEGTCVTITIDGGWMDVQPGDRG